LLSFSELFGLGEVTREVLDLCSVLVFLKLEGALYRSPDHCPGHMVAYARLRAAEF